MIVLAASEYIAGVAASGSVISYLISGMELDASNVESYKTLAQGQLANSAGTLYTAPSAHTAFIKSIHLVNTTGADVAGIKLYASGTDNAHRITGSLTIPANGWATMEEDGWRVYGPNGQLLTGASSGLGGTLYVQSAAPSSPQKGDRWLRTDDGIQTEWLDDGSGWVETGPTQASIAATTSAQGIVELATAAETMTATDTERAITPNALSEIVKAVLRHGRKNFIVNPQGAVAQQPPGSAGDAVYNGFDQWYHLVQTAAVTASQLTDVENGTPYAMRITQAQASAQRFGIAQPIEAFEAKALRGQNILLAARVRMSVTTKLRFAVLEFTGAADTITKDVVNDWTSSNFTPGNFFYLIGLNVLATGSYDLTANTLASISLAATVGNSCNNLFVVFWTDSTQAQNVTLDVSNVFLGLAVTADPFGPFVARPFATELALCLRFWQQTYEYGTAIATATTTGIFDCLFGYAATTAAISTPVRFVAPMRVTPTVHSYDASGNIDKVNKPSANKTAAINFTTRYGTNIGTADATSSNEMYFHYTADARL